MSLQAPLHDPLLEELLSDLGAPERPHYAAGVLLSAEDYLAEQQYHRARLSRVLALLFGAGTVAGLRVSCSVQGEIPDRELVISVAPGLALDRLGRIIEVRRAQSLRVGRWLTARAGIADARNDTLAAVSGTPPVLPLDVFARFVLCPHGQTPAFANGPFDATDYTVPDRIADSFELTLGLATAAAPASSAPRLPAPASAAEVVDFVTRDLAPRYSREGRLEKLAEHERESDWERVFLARVEVPVSNLDPDPYPVLDLDRAGFDAATLARNELRPVVFNPAAWRGAR